MCLDVFESRMDKRFEEFWQSRLKKSSGSSTHPKSHEKILTGTDEYLWPEIPVENFCEKDFLNQKTKWLHLKLTTSIFCPCKKLNYSNFYSDTLKSDFSQKECENI
jgi:hypothetical protein